MKIPLDTGGGCGMIQGVEQPRKRKKDVATQRKTKPRRKTGFALHPENINRDGKAVSEGKRFASWLRSRLEAIDPATGESANEKLANYLQDIAAAGGGASVSAIVALWDRAYGKPAQTMDVTSGGASFAEAAARLAQDEFKTGDGKATAGASE